MALYFCEMSAKTRTSLEADTWNGKSHSLKGQNLAELELHNAKVCVALMAMVPLF